MRHFDFVWKSVLPYVQGLSMVDYAAATALSNVNLAWAADKEELCDNARNPEMCHELRRRRACYAGLVDVAVGAVDWDDLIERCREWDREHSAGYLDWLTENKPELFQGEF